MPDVLPLHKPTPICLAVGDFVPDRYIVQTTSYHCQHCNSTTESAQTFALCYLRRRNPGTHGNYIEHMVPVDRLSYNVPIDVRRRTAILVALCIECMPWTANSGYHSPDLSHLPRPPRPDRPIVAVFQAPSEPEKKRQPAAASKPALDILEF